MRITKRRVGGGFLLAAAIFIGQEFFSWAFGKMLDIATEGIGAVSWTAFPWQSSFATVLALVGGYLAFWPSKKLGGVSKAQRFGSLWASADIYIKRVRFQRGLSWFETGHNGAFIQAEDPADIARDGLSLLIKFENEGIAVPKFDINSAEKIAVGCEAYFAELAAFMRDGHVDQVKTLAPHAAERAKTTAMNLNPEHWYIEYAKKGY